MTEYEMFVKYRDNYMLVGDLDKPFHRPECSCVVCEDWRKDKGRPTFEELSKMPKEEKGNG